MKEGNVVAWSGHATYTIYLFVLPSSHFHRLRYFHRSTGVHFHRLRYFHRSTGPPESRTTGVPDHRSTGAPETWNLQRLWELTIASSKVLQGPPRSSKVLQGAPRPRKTLSYNRPWRTSDDLHMTYNDLGDYLVLNYHLVQLSA